MDSKQIDNELKKIEREIKYLKRLLENRRFLSESPSVVLSETKNRLESAECRKASLLQQPEAKTFQKSITGYKITATKEPVQWGPIEINSEQKRDPDLIKIYFKQRGASKNGNGYKRGAALTLTEEALENLMSHIPEHGTYPHLRLERQ